jgi:pilus assembly protein Flp/PilA
MKIIKSFLADESGASAAEYVLILALIGLAIIVGAGSLGTAMNGAMTDTGDTITTAVP